MPAVTIPTRPAPSEEELRQFYVGKDIADVPAPAVVLDVGTIRKNCQAMLLTVKNLDVGFRAHVKTHKTTQLAQLQVGEESKQVNLVASTIPEVETLVPLLKEFQRSGRRVNVLYGIPLVPSQVPRLAQAALELGDESISVMIDHPDQLDYLTNFSAITGFPACVFVKVDSGYHRAGLPPAFLNKKGLLEKLAEAEKQGHARLQGVYSHNSLSYKGTSPDEAMANLTSEITSCIDALKHNASLLPKDRTLVISVGATPQVISVQNLLQNGYTSNESETLKKLLNNPGIFGPGVKIELHAGVYPVLDMQQMATHARVSAGALEEEVAISVIAEVCSVYNDGERSKAEALVAAGSLALGREPCPSYPGWGVIAPWRQEKSLSTEQGKSRLIVDRISQEHAIVSWESGAAQLDKIPLSIGQKVRIYPNHACVTGALYGWYLVVDSTQDPEASKIVDVWMRASGW